MIIKPPPLWRAGLEDILCHNQTCSSEIPGRFPNKGPPAPRYEVFCQGEIANRFITVADEEGKRQRNGRRYGRRCLAPMHRDVVRDVRGTVKNRLEYRLQEAGTSSDFQKGLLDFIEGYYCSVNLLNSA